MISRVTLLFLIAVAIIATSLVLATATSSTTRKLKSKDPRLDKKKIAIERENFHKVRQQHLDAKLLPANFDWTLQGFDLPIWGGHSECGGLTVAAAVADAISGADFVSNKLARPTRCSAAQLIDCFDVEDGCCGGFPDGTLQAIMTNSSGLVATDADYPWSSINQNGGEGACRSDPSSWKACASKVVGFEKLPDNEWAIKEYVYRFGPVMVVTDPSYLYNYTAGQVVSGDSCNFSYYEHVLLITGWGVKFIDGTATEAWIARSDFGSQWGNGGSVWLKYGVNCSGIAGWARAAKVAPRS